jgi:hypothetical protein
MSKKVEREHTVTYYQQQDTLSYITRYLVSISLMTKKLRESILQHITSSIIPSLTLHAIWYLWDV